jgi:hypothetical protein
MTAHARVVSPRIRKAPRATSASSTTQPTMASWGRNTASTNHEYGATTGYSTAWPAQKNRPRSSSRPKSGGTFQPAFCTHSTPSAMRSTARPAPVVDGRSVTVSGAAEVVADVLTPS